MDEGLMVAMWWLCKEDMSRQSVEEHYERKPWLYEQEQKLGPRLLDGTASLSRKEAMLSGSVFRRSTLVAKAEHQP